MTPGKRGTGRQVQGLQVCGNARHSAGRWRVVRSTMDDDRQCRIGEDSAAAKRCAHPGPGTGPQATGRDGAGHSRYPSCACLGCSRLWQCMSPIRWRVLEGFEMKADRACAAAVDGSTPVCTSARLSRPLPHCSCISLPVKLCFLLNLANTACAGLPRPAPACPCLCPPVPACSRLFLPDAACSCSTPPTHHPGQTASTPARSATCSRQQRVGTCGAPC